MLRYRQFVFVSLVTISLAATVEADWRQFRGPHSLGVSDEKGLPIQWSADKNVVWRVALPGLGASSPITTGQRIFVTCYSGYGLDQKDVGQMNDLRRHILCLDRTNGKILWHKEYLPLLPEHLYRGEGSYHGYSASTPVTDGEHLFVFFGKSGVYCLDLDGNEVWHASVGKGTDGWGSGASPVLYKDLVLVNGSVESGSLVALNIKTGKEVWRAPRISRAWNTPVLVTTPSGGMDLVISVQGRVVGLDPDTGKELWYADGIHRYVCPSVVAHRGIVYATGGGQGHTTLAVRTGGRGDVTKSHVLWRVKKGSNVSSPIYHEGHLYWAGDGGIVHCQEAATGKFLYSERLLPGSGKLWASPVLADGRLYYVSQGSGTYVVAGQPKFEQLARNVFQDDNSRANASVAVSHGQLLLRTDRYLYCLGQR
jgi:outer membrane protein assembly factor BamB